MRRSAKPATARVAAKPSVARKARKNGGSKVRDLEKRLAEALEQQAATAEILRVMGRSQTDLQPVFDTIAQSAVRLCGGVQGNVVRFDGELVHRVAGFNLDPEGEEAFRRYFPRALGRDLAITRAILDGSVVHLPDRLQDADYLRELAQATRARAVLAVPMLRDGHPIGAISVVRREPWPFSDNQIDLLRTFADQAVLAIENVRLFNETKEALEQQTATAEILRVISSSPTDVQPVFDTIIRNAVRLSGAAWAIVTRVDAGFVHLVTHHNLSAEVLARLRRIWPHPAPGSGPTSQVVRTGQVFRAADIESEDCGLSAEASADFRARGIRSMLVVPMFREGRVVGTINLTHQAINAFSDAHVALVRTFADHAVIAIENVRLFRELQASNRELTDALERQTATSEILGVISRSPTDIQPVLDAVAESATRLCAAHDAIIFRLDGDILRRVAHCGPIPAPVGFAIPASRTRVTGRAVVDGQPVQVADAQAKSEDFPESEVFAREHGFRTILSVPLLREGIAIGTIDLRRTQVQTFTETQIALLQTFGAQAVIAIENVRLFKELQEKNWALTQAHAQVTEALDQQTATSEILRVISSSPTDLQPVLDAVAQSAARLCNANDALIYRLEGDHLKLVAKFGPIPYATGTLPLTRGLVTSRAVIDRQTLHIEDLATQLDEFPDAEMYVREFSHRTILITPLLREGVALGAIGIRRTEVQPFADSQIDLLKTFADQAVIAIENVRLFKELEEKNRALTEALERQTATSEILRVISSSPTDVQPVFDTIVKSVARLCDGMFASLHRYDGEHLHWVAQHNFTVDGLDAMRSRYPMRAGPDTASGRAVIDRAVVHIRDFETDPAAPATSREISRAFGYRSLITVPLLREGQPLGAIAVARRDGPFSAGQIALLQTFADQAVIAIENVRLFTELQARNLEIEDKSRQLEAASQHKSEFLANMSHELRTPLNAVIGFSEVLGDRLFGDLNEKQEEYLNDIHASGQHLLSLINDILDLSKIEAGRMELELTDFDLPTAIDNALTLVRERAGRRGIALHQAADEELGQIRGDERKIKQVLLNLLSNAIKFTPDGGRIDVRAVAVDGSVEVSVSDTGVGIAPEDQEAIFEEFRQVGTAAKKVEGTGLGLALSRKFIELHGGRIWVQSQVGMGSTFTFTIPIRHER